MFQDEEYSSGSSSGYSSTSTSKLYQNMAKNIVELMTNLVKMNEHKDEKKKIVSWAASRVLKVAEQVAKHAGEQIIEKDEKTLKKTKLVEKLQMLLAGVDLNDLMEALKVIATANDRNGEIVSHPWTKQKVLGKGAFGVVHLAVDSKGMKFAVKEVPRGSMQELSLRDEIICLTRLSHKNIVKCYGCARDGEYVYMYMELLLGSIRDKLNEDEGALSEKQAGKYTVDLLDGLQYLHSNDIIHRDIKCGNVLLDSSGVAKLADMGVSKNHDQETQRNYEEQAGTFFWMSPEVMKGYAGGRRSDMWGVGCTVFEMVKGEPPFHQCGILGLLFGPVIGNKIMNLEHYDLVKSDAEMSEPLRKFLMKIFVKMEDRPLADEMAQHEWLGSA